jgi:hypothetical protein
MFTGHTQARGPSTDFDLVGDSNDTDDFLSRERALLGDDADQFASENDKLATVEDGDDDLLGGDFSQAHVGGQQMDGFESSFPAIDTSNDVSSRILLQFTCALPRVLDGSASWRRHISLTFWQHLRHVLRKH